MDKQQREREEIQRAFAEVDSVSRFAPMVQIGDLKGFRKAMEVCERMQAKAPTSQEMREEARRVGKKLPCALCSGIGYVQASENVVQICSCRQSAINAARQQQLERERPDKDLVAILFEEDQ